MFQRLIALLYLLTIAVDQSFAADEAKYRTLFNDVTLSGWTGNPELWSVRQGSIVGETTNEKPIADNTFLLWQGGDVEVGDFDFRCKVRFQGNNSGVQYRSQLLDKKNFRVAGYQADLHSNQANFGMLYGENYENRGIIATRGQRLEVRADGSKSDVTTLPQPDQLVDNQWNDLRIIAVGNRLIHQINGVTTIDVTDNHPQARRRGILALQLHAGPAMKVEFRNLLLRELTAETGNELIQTISVTTAKQTAAPESDTRADKRTWLTKSPAAQWIWAAQSSENQQVFFRKTFPLDSLPKTANLYSTCDNHVKLWINGTLVGESHDWNKPISENVAKSLRVGQNVIAAECKNDGGPAAFVLKLATGNEKPTTIVSDNTWKLSESAAERWQETNFNDAAWKSEAVKIVGALGVEPWKIPKFDDAGAITSGDPLHPKNVLTLSGFVVDQLYRVPKSQGSWVCLTNDGHGGFYASDQDKLGLFQITSKGDGVTVEPLAIRDPEDGQLLSAAQGLVWAFDSLWMHRNGGHLYRITDSNKDGKLDKAERYPSQTGGGEHGNHALIVTEDGQGIYMVGGNHAPLGDCVTKRVQSWSEDHLLPRMWDAKGHARGVLAPGGWVTRLDPVKKTQELVCIGFRNHYDIALNPFGDLFTFDSDMEWDMGSAWYRPTRICQVVSGGDYGWRSGSGVYPTYYEDSLPPVIDIGPGSPTGIVFGTGAKFPSKYQEALYALDWTFGTIYAVHLTPEGAGYNGRKEPFIYGSPLPVTDAIIGADGHFYFTVGGRGTDSALYRVRYVGSDYNHDQLQQRLSEARRATVSSARVNRRNLEAFHGRVDPQAVNFAWPYLGSPDRFIRNAARVAIESQPVDQWALRVYTEPNPQARITGAVALARSGTHDHQELLVNCLLDLKLNRLPEDQLLGCLRACSLAFTRLGEPDKALKERVTAKLNPLFPETSANVNQELLMMLVYLRAPGVVERAMMLIETGSPPVIPDWEEIASRNPGYGGSIKLMRDNPPPSRELGYAFTLRNLDQGWTLEQRRAYFEFLNRAAKGSGGASYPGFLQNIRDEALATCTNEQRNALQKITGEDFNPVPNFEVAAPKGPGRKWTVDEALAATNGKPNFERGRSLYFGADCGKCHRLGGLGGGVGPDLTSIPNKFDARYVVEAIINPSKNISDQYGSSNVLLDDGRVLTGIVVEKNDQLEIYPIKATDEPIRVSRKDVESIEPAKISQMPEGLLDRLSADEIRDLVGYLMSAGVAADRRYQK